MKRVLFASSEAHPLIKTGGLADVSASLPQALQQMGQEVHIILPAYRQVLSHLEPLETEAELRLPGDFEPIRLLRGQFPGTRVPLWLVDAPSMFDRDGGPYQGPDGRDWDDNAQRFTLFARACVELATGRAVPGWQADAVHCNDWQTGLIPALLQLEARRPATVFTIHNLAYQGLFSFQTFQALHLPHSFWGMHAMEFHGQFSFIKGGLVYADRITTVSPTYAEEIKQPEYGYGLEGLLNHRAGVLSGILNGVDYQLWDPRHDEFIACEYDTRSLKNKRLNKRALQKEMRLPQRDEIPLVAFVGRMVDQKGIDLILEALPQILRQSVQCVILGSGAPHYEQAFTELASHYPDNMGVHIGYNEALAHQVEAGSDIFLMPSRFEPCGLNQIYSLRYGTVPVVRNTGGLADTVVDVSDQARKAKTATGFCFEHATTEGLLWALNRALKLYPRPRLWRQLMVTGMTQDFSWESSARHYLKLYQQIVTG